MTKKKKEKYIKSIEEFDKWARAHCKQGMIYRGIKDCRLPVSASVLYRRDNNSPQNMSEFIAIIKQLIEDAKGEGHHQKDGKEMKDLQLLAELQHNGAATCLIDFTHNSRIALWFACGKLTEKQKNEESYKGSKIVVLNTKVPKNSEKFKIIQSEDWEKDINEFLGKKQLWIWDPPKQNHRIVAQQSVFVLGKGIIENKEIDEICFIDREARESILIELEKQGFSENSLYCDFAGFAQQKSWEKVRQDDLTPDDYIRRAIFSYQSNNWNKAIEHCEKAIDKDKRNATAYFLCALASGRNSNFDKAIACLEEVLRINSKYKDARYNLGITRLHNGNFDRAIIDFRAVIQSNRRHYEAYSYRALAKVGIGNYKGAIADFDKATGINDQYAEAYYCRGRVQYQLGNYEQAKKDYRDAKDISPNNPNFVPYSTFTTHKYYFKVGNKIVHAGITNDLERREAKHQNSRPTWKNGHIKQVGYITTRENALEWEAKQQQQGKPAGP